MWKIRLVFNMKKREKKYIFSRYVNRLKKEKTNKTNEGLLFMHEKKK